MVSPRALAVVCAFLISCSVALGQTSVASNPQAVSIASKILQSLAGATPLSDITLQASVTYTAGSDEETGTATLVADGNSQSAVTLNLSSGQLQEIRNGTEGAWIDSEGTAHAMATHNCFIDADWFSPALGLQALSTDPTSMIGLVGQQVYEGHQVYHLTLFHYLSGPTPDVVALVERVSSIDLYVDSTTLQPVAMDFNAHPDKDANINIPVEIRFGAYQSFNGVWAPTTIQKYVDNSLLLNLTVSSVAVNSSLAAGAFALPSVGGAQ